MFVHANAATSADGKLSTRRREQIEISGPADFDRVDAIRADSDAVLVGVGTVLADDPSLTVDDADRVAERASRGKREQPTRVIADSRARTPLDARVLDDNAPTTVLVADAAPDENVAALRDAGATVHRAGDERVDLGAGLEALESDGVDRLLVEGGGELFYSLFAADLVDRLTLYVGSTIVGGRDAPTLVDGEGFVEKFPTLSLEDVDRVDDGVLLRYGVE